MYSYIINRGGDVVVVGVGVVVVVDAAHGAL
jgi:hypothetical protein